MPRTQGELVTKQLWATPEQQMQEAAPLPLLNFWGLAEGWGSYLTISRLHVVQGELCYDPVS